jgi:hypothetical protein
MSAHTGKSLSVPTKTVESVDASGKTEAAVCTPANRAALPAPRSLLATCASGVRADGEGFTLVTIVVATAENSRCRVQITSVRDRTHSS